MRLLLAFLVAAFVLGGTAVPRAQAIRRPLVFLGMCVAVGAMFYSRRVL